MPAVASSVPAVLNATDATESVWPGSSAVLSAPSGFSNASWPTCTQRARVRGAMPRKGVKARVVWTRGPNIGTGEGASTV
eukprot:56005-Chlamydomonas_euryale.AAC.1